MRSREGAPVAVALLLALGVMLLGTPTAPPVADAAMSGATVERGDARLEPAAHHDLGGGGLHADVWLHRGVAYVGSWRSADPEQGCGGLGVRAVEVIRPAPAQFPPHGGARPLRPALVASLAAYPSTTAEVVRVRAVATPAFRGDLLAVGLQACADEGLRGVDLWDVTDPRAPRRLGFFDVGPGVGGVHELDLVQRPDGRVLALLAVPFSETGHPEGLGDLRIVEVTDPRNPRMLASWGARAALGAGQEAGRGLDPSVYAHSARAGPDGRRAYVSYWDAGVMILDLADPAAPALVGRTGFAPEEEGNAHSVDVAPDERLLIEATEVLTVEAPVIRVEGPPDLAGPIRAGGTLLGPPWQEAERVAGELADLGRGCPAGDWTAQLNNPEARLEVADPYPRDPGGTIALLERGLCPFGEKLDRARAAGAIGAVIVNTEDAPLTPHSLDGTPLGALGIPRPAGERLRAALAAGATVTVSLDPAVRLYQDFGGLRFWDVADPAAPRLLGTFQTPRSRVDPARGPVRPGDFSAHNPVVHGQLLLVYWFSDGIRVLDVRDPAAPRELDAWVPPAPATSGAVEQGHLGHVHRFEGPSVWGVAVEGDLVAASDMFTGLYLFRLLR
jgi:hypothetical protein